MIENLGELRDGTTNAVNVPVAVIDTALTNPIAIASGYHHNYAISASFGSSCRGILLF